jgi:hypothetical protein
MTKIFIASLMVLMILGGAQSAETPHPTPILVELFTSEGCSSCPPADAWLQRIDTAQPIPGAEVIVLSEHVDYWNHDGWKDPYSSLLMTERQNEYVNALKLKIPFTPQVIVDGTVNLDITDAQQMVQAFQQAAADTTIPVHITSATIDLKSPAILHTHIEADGDSANNNADIYEAVALDHAESQVLRGENSGKHLTHVAVVENLTEIGKLQKGKNFNQDVEVKLKSAIDSKNLRVVVFVQKPGPGEVLGAAVQESIH